MLLTNLAQEVFDELGSPSDKNVPSIIFWMQTNLGVLNTALRNNFIADEGGNVTPDMDANEQYIYKQIYTCDYYEKRVVANLGAAANDVIEIVQAGKRVRLVNKNEISKVYKDLWKTCKDGLRVLIQDYRLGKSSPLQVAGNENSTVVHSFLTLPTS